MTDLDEQRTTHEYRLIERCFWLRTRLQKDARRHLHHGFTQRLFMLQAARMNLLEHADPQDRNPRGVYVGTELSLQVNAYYLNVRAGLDNLAWCLQFQWAVMPGTTETDGQRTAINLFGGAFLAALARNRGPLVAEIKKRDNWAANLSRRRDPAAHRIPLQVPYTVFSEEDAHRFTDLEAEAARLMKSGEYDAGMERLHSTSSLGSFRSWLVQSGPDGPMIVDLHAQVGSDHDEFLSLADIVIHHLEKES